MACATVKISMTNLTTDKKNNHKYWLHDKSRNSVRRSALVNDEQKFDSMCGGAQTTFIVWVLVPTVGIAMTANVNGCCYVALRRSNCWNTFSLCLTCRWKRHCRAAIAASSVTLLRFIIRRHKMSLGTILLIILILLLIGAVPSWPHSRNWGYGPSGGLGLVLVILIILLLMGKI